jgi:two-component system sensor kinase FixL
LELAQGLATASCDSVQVQQVLINLIQNAVAAMTDQKPSERRLVIRTAPGDGVVQVSVIDTGCGLPPELRERVFEPFMTTKPDGLGIGLSICRGIIESHGGRITATANPDKGTTFRFTLRLA